MRVEPYTKDSIVHVVKRGARGMDIVLDEADKWQFVRSLYLMNDTYSNGNWRRETADLKLFERPDHWPKREPLTRILAWVLMSNHLHLLLQEIEEGGVSKFIQRLCGSMTLSFNVKHDSKGSIFQGSYKARRVDDDSYLRYLAFYVQVKNVLENYPGGLKAALSNFDEAWEWALRYPFSSLPAYALGSGSPILSDTGDMIASIHREGLSKKDAYGLLSLYVEKGEDALDDRFKILTFK